MSYPNRKFAPGASLAALALVTALAPSAAARAADRGSIPNDRIAPIAMLVDAGSGQVLFSREVDRRFMPASITKVMTVYTAFDLLNRGKLRPEQRFAYSEGAFREWFHKGSTLFIPRDAKPTVNELLYGITTVSGNDASIVLAEGAGGTVADWVALMNREARGLGMTDSHFGRPNGYMDEGHTFTTARDLTLLGTALTQQFPTLYRRYFGKKGLRAYGYAQENHDPISGAVPGADGIKTGFTGEAGYGFLGSAERDGRRLVMVIAASGAGRERNAAARELIEWGFANFDDRPLFPAGSAVAAARVQNGAASQVPLVANKPVRVSVPKGTHPNIELNLRYDGPVRAPVAKGTQVARLEIAVEGMETSSIPLFAAEDVPQAGFFRRIVNGFRGLFA